jgi:hypothetical protein
MLALEELTKDVESELEENILRFSLSLKGRLTLEWSWQEDQTKGGWECTILAHINTGQSGISAQKRRNLHWKTLESILGMNNNIAFAGPTHGLLLKTGLTSSDHQIRKSASASLLTSASLLLTIVNTYASKTSRSRAPLWRRISEANFTSDHTVIGGDFNHLEERGTGVVAGERRMHRRELSAWHQLTLQYGLTNA